MIALNNLSNAQNKVKEVSIKTPLQFSRYLSEKYNCKVFLKREDLQPVRSYKIRGAYNKIVSLTKKEQEQGVVCSSAGNHAQGVAYSCFYLKIYATIFMPTTTPKQKIERVKDFGKNFVTIKLIGDTYDDSYNAAITFCNNNNKNFISPFNDIKVIEGQATIGIEILEQFQIEQNNRSIDKLILPIGGGGLCSGVSEVFRQNSKNNSYKDICANTEIIGTEPEGAPSMSKALEAGKVIELGNIDSFIDGASLKKVGTLTFPFCQKNINYIKLIPEGLACKTILSLYNNEGVIVEPAGALSVSALELIKESIDGQTIVCIISGGNNDIIRTEEIRERALLYDGLKHYFIINFPQRPGALKEFINNIISENDNITLFEYSKKNNREQAPAFIGIELEKKENLNPLMKKLKDHNIKFEYLNNNPILFQYLI